MRPPPTLEWIHVCDYAFRDEQGKLCLIGMFDHLASVQLPGRLPMLCVAFGLTDGLGEYPVSLRVTRPSGENQDFPLPPVQLKDRHAKARAVVRLASMPFPEFGTYVFQLVVDGQPMDAPVHVVEHVQARQQAPPQPPPYPQG